MSQRIVTLLFLVIHGRSAFKGILGRSFLVKLDVVASIVHLKIAYQDEWGVPNNIEEVL